MPKVSVIIPIYGVEKYIERCAKSLFEQTLDDIEYIFINDCTPDNSVEILKSTLNYYPNRIPQTRIINLEKNNGAAKAREIGIKQALGEYVIHCDSDDWVDLDMYEILYKEAVDHSADVAICDMYESNGNSNILYPQVINLDKDIYIGDLISRKSTCSLCNKLVKRKIVQNSSIIFPKSHMLEDQLLCVQYMLSASKYIVIHKPLYYYYFNTQSVCHEISEYSCEKRAIESQDNINLLITILKNDNLLNKYKHEIVRLKYTPRMFIWPILLENPNKYIPIWRKIYPEINWQYMFTKGIPCSLKIIFFLALINIYPFLYKIFRR